MNLQPGSRVETDSARKAQSVTTPRLGKRHMTSPTIHYGVSFHDARIQRVCLSVDLRLVYELSSLPVICHAGNVREVYSYDARVLVYDFANFEASLA